MATQHKRPGRTAKMERQKRALKRFASHELGYHIWRERQEISVLADKIGDVNNALRDVSESFAAYAVSLRDYKRRKDDGKRIAGLT